VSSGVIHYITTNGIGNAWVANELHRVGAEGIPFRLHALYRDRVNFFASEWAEELERSTNYLYPIRPVAVACASALAPARFGSRFWQALGNAIFGERETFANRIKGIVHLAVACLWASSLRKDPPSRIHSQWIHSCGSVGMYGAWLLGVPFSFTGHAADLFRERAALRDKIRRADRIVCISNIGEGTDPAKLMTVYCGIDTSHFRPLARERMEPPLRIRSAGRLVEKKGFADLIDACALLRDRGVPFNCIIGGSGPLDQALRDRIAARGLDGMVQLTGESLKQERIPEFMSGADVFCLPCVWAKDDDVDGLPQMLMEAMACGLPSVSTRLVGIPDLIEHGRGGLLVEPGDVEGIADAIEQLFLDADLRMRLAAGGRTRVLEAFDLRNCLEPLFELHRKSLPNGSSTPAIVASAHRETVAAAP
jgi:colanic acid/amylovoran biosynthesis glycosyltransferase